LDVLQGIIHLHKHHVVHRDLKPGNILIVKRGDKIIPVITDFGLSKQVWQDGQSRFSNSFGGGTLKYSSPEQLRGEELRLNTDLWSFGVIVHQIFTGKDLFSAVNQNSGSAETEKEIFEQILNKDLSKALSALPPQWAKAASVCLVRKPAQRIKSAEVLLKVINGTATTDDTGQEPDNEGTKIDEKNGEGTDTGQNADGTKIDPGVHPQPQPKPQPKPKPQPDDLSLSKGQPSKSPIGWIIGGVVVLVFILLLWQPWSTSDTFTDTRDGKTYKTVKIGTQTWMAENLNYSTGNSWCYDNNTSNCTKYGRLYDWNTARSACPIGWHLPSRSDLEALLSNVGGRGSNAYHALKEGGSSGFSALFGGWRDGDGRFDEHWGQRQLVVVFEERYSQRMAPVHVQSQSGCPHGPLRQGVGFFCALPPGLKLSICLFDYLGYGAKPHRKF
ncbi:MAG: FISUMP domain-containing protein, partial [Bacteroidales bacterium]|nr:FISUMP domain-containing protein [Bacteroidales bacterium]